MEMAGGDSAVALSVLNFCWGAGAIVCKPFVDLAGNGNIESPTLILAVLFGLSGLVILIFPVKHKLAERQGTSDTVKVKIWMTPLAWLLAAFNFIHIGFESGIGGWLTAYTDRVDPLSATNLFSPFVLYFCFLVAGRAVVPVFFRYLSENVALTLSLVTIILGLLVALSAANSLQLGIGAAIAGFGTSTVFPTNVARFGHIFGPEASRQATPLFIAGTLGGAVLSWLIGFLSNQMASLRSAMFVLVASVVVLLVLQTLIMLRGTARKYS
jgi:fucose permease